MWEPDPSWQRLPGGRGASTAGVWCAELAGERRFVKRLVAPRNAPGLGDSTHWAYWRREVEVANADAVSATPGLRAPACLRVDEDPGGATLWFAWVERVELADEVLAEALGGFAASGLPETTWTSRGALSSRVRWLERGDGWGALTGTEHAGVAAAVWRDRDRLLDRYRALPVVPSHGDAIRANLRGRDGSHDGVVAVDWSALGHEAVGADLGVLGLSASLPFADLAVAYAAGLERGGVRHPVEQILAGASVMAAFTLLTRAAHAIGEPEQERRLADLARFDGLLEALLTR